MSPKTVSAVMVVAAFAVFGMFVFSFVAALFGPAGGQLVGIPAFVCMVGLLGFQENRRQACKLYDFSKDHPAVARLQKFIWLMMGVCVFLFFATFLTQLFTADGHGVADGSRPIFEERSKYELNNHGTRTVVSEWEYRVVGISFMLGWHSAAMLGVLAVLHRAVFGDDPHFV